MWCPPLRLLSPVVSFVSRYRLPWTPDSPPSSAPRRPLYRSGVPELLDWDKLAMSQHLNVIQHPGRKLPAPLLINLPPAIPPAPKTELTVFHGGGFQRPRSEEPALTRFHCFYCALGGVMERPAGEIEGPREESMRVSGALTSNGFVSGVIKYQDAQWSN